MALEESDCFKEFKSCLVDEIRKLLASRRNTSTKTLQDFLVTRDALAHEIADVSVPPPALQDALTKTEVALESAKEMLLSAGTPATEVEALPDVRIINDAVARINAKVQRWSTK